MNRVLLIVVMVLLPLQMVWAAAAPYCGHEARLAAAAKHFGHHEHQHEASQSAAPEADTGEAAGTQHPDCANCHLGTIATPAAPALEIAALNPGNVQAAPADPYRSHIPVGPERPDRIELTAAARHGNGAEFRPLNR